MRRPWKLAVSFVFSTVLLLCAAVCASVKPAIAANPSTISFQGKVVNANGTNVTDGTYSFIFKLYNTTTSTGSTVTSASCTGDSHCLWAESDSVTVSSGVFQVNLGTNTALSTIDFNANSALYLGIEFNADSSEMSPRPQLQSVPYAFNADKVGGLSASQLAQLSGAQQTGSINVNGNGTFGTGLTVSSGTASFTGALTVAGTFSQTYSSGVSGTAKLVTTTDTNTSATATTINGLGISLVGTNNPNATNTNNAVSFTNVPTGTNNIFNALAFGTGYTNLLQSASFTVTAAGNITNTGTYNGATFSSSALTYPNAATLGTTAGQLTLSSASGILGLGTAVTELMFANTGNANDNIDSAGQLNISSGNGIIGLGNDVTTLQRVTTGTSLITTLDLKDTTTANTTLQLFNSGTGVSNLQLYGGVLCTGSATCTVGGTTQRLDNAGNLTNIGNYTSTGGIIAGEVNDSKTEATNTATFAYSETVQATGYYLSSTSYPGAGATAPVNTVSTFTIPTTTLPATDGTLAFFTVSNIKQAAGNTLNTATTHSTVLVIGTQTIATLTNASSNAASTITRSFTVMRMNGTWRIVGEAPTTAATAAQSTATTADYAEYIHYSGDVQPQAGDVVSVGSESTSVHQAFKDYDTNALGVVSTSPYQVGGADDGHSVILALTGRVPINVSLENGPIKAGDKLTASSTPGEAMKATKAGHIIGTALSDYDGSHDTAQVIVQLGVGYDNPSDDTAAEVTSSSATDDGALQLNTDTTPAVTTDNGITTVGSQALKFVNGASLDLTSDVSGNAISLVDTPDNLAKANANGIFVQQGKAAAGATTGLSGALTIDNADATLPIGSAINITDTGGGGYTSVISSTNFSVSGAGDVSANGAYVSKNGSFQLLDASGKKLISFDNAGNGSLSGALNVASANVSGGLTVGGDLNVAGLSTFQKMATFIAKTVFKQDVEFDGHITVASDTAGYAILRTGETTVHVSFQKPYDSAPVVNTSLISGQFILDEVTNITPAGFDISLQTPATAATTFSWTAVAVNNPLTAINPQPATAAVPAPTSTTTAQ